MALTDIELESTRDFGYLVRAGRAVVFPEYFATYARRLPPDADPALRRSMRPNWRKDLGRTLDALAGHAELDHDGIGLLGVSLGANGATTMLAVEPRIATAVLVATGLHATARPAELDPINFLPRIRQPVLLVGGRDDLVNPLATSQQPLFERLGAPASQKAHYVFDGGHVPARQQEVVRVVLDWFDRHLGPVPLPPR